MAEVLQQVTPKLKCPPTVPRLGRSEENVKPEALASELCGHPCGQDAHTLVLEGSAPSFPTVIEDTPTML